MRIFVYNKAYAAALQRARKNDLKRDSFTFLHCRKRRFEYGVSGIERDIVHGKHPLLHVMYVFEYRRIDISIL